MPLRALLCTFALLATGCVTHMAPINAKHMQIRWQRDFESARAEAQRSGRPMLVTLVAGDLQGLC